MAAARCGLARHAKPLCRPSHNLNSLLAATWRFGPPLGTFGLLWIVGRDSLIVDAACRAYLSECKFGRKSPRKNEPSTWLKPGNEPQAILPFQFTELRPGKDKSVLLASTDFIDKEVLTRFAGNCRGVAGNVFFIEKLAQQPSYYAADGVDYFGLTAQPLDDARYVDSASPGSRRSDVPRSFVTGNILSTEVDRSTAGFGVIVTISTISWLPRSRRFG